jgi:hypothetical protein
MQTPPERMDAIFTELGPEEMPDFLRGIDIFERCGVLSRDEAATWRMAFSSWIAQRSGQEETDGAA